MISDREMSMIEKATAFAVTAHAGTTRKGKSRPYILHPAEAMVIVASMTEEPEVIAAAVLHDVVEDTNITAESIRREFGERVAALVLSESEDKMRDVAADASWKARKQATIDHLGTLDKDAKLICLGDKLSNIREISRDYKELKENLWEKFNQTDKRLHAWYYRSILEILAAEFGEVPAIREYRELWEEVFGEEEDETA